MMCPELKWIKMLKGGIGPEGHPPFFMLNQAKAVHPNPRFYKYYWWVFWAGSPVEGKAFLESRHRLPTAAAFEFMEELKGKKEPYLLYSRQLHRRDPAGPFDFSLPMFRDRELALPYHGDFDPVVAKGELTGHR